MKKSVRNYLPAVLIMSISLLFLISCGSRSSVNNTDNSKDPFNTGSEPSVETASLQQTNIPGEVMDRGEKIYGNYCLACHQADGTGNPGMYPPLDQTETVLGDKTVLIKILLNGLTGKIEVKGETYYQAMPPHNFLSDQQIADVLTYIRNSFGNSATEVKTEEVRKARDAGNQS
jgi:mono/diheme cytochrome c family protein